MGPVPRGRTYAAGVKPLRLTLSLLALGLAASASQAQQTPRQLIARLGLDTRAGDSREWTKQHETEAAVASQLRRFIHDHPGDPGLTETDTYGRTPLMEAAANGYVDVVESLLMDASVQARVNEADRFGASAWALSQFARPLTLIACLEFQAGVPVVADIRLVSGRMEPRTAARFQFVLLHALSSYECAGDHIIEQEFRFKVQ